MQGRNLGYRVALGQGRRRSSGALPGLVARNRLLGALPPDDRGRLLPHLEERDLHAGAVLFRPGDRVSHVHFPAGAVVSLLVVMPDGAAAEAATVGREGAVGAVAGGADRAAFTRGTVQVAGPALRAELGAVEEARVASPALRDLLDRYADALLAQVLQSVACNVLHPLGPRLARWLLMTLDRSDGTVPLTQEALAAMLGAHRVSVTDVLAAFEADGVLCRGRGRIDITDRAALEARACPCYRAVRGHQDRLLPGLPA